MKVDRIKLRSHIENIIGNGVVNGEEIDVTTANIMEAIEELIRAVELEKAAGRDY